MWTRIALRSLRSRVTLDALRSLRAGGSLWSWRTLRAGIALRTRYATCGQVASLDKVRDGLSLDFQTSTADFNDVH